MSVSRIAASSSSRSLRSVCDHRLCSGGPWRPSRLLRCPTRLGETRTGGAPAEAAAAGGLPQNVSRSLGSLSASAGHHTAPQNLLPSVPRVLSWYKPNAAFDMEKVVKILEDHHIPVEVSFPPTSSSTAANAAPEGATEGRRGGGSGASQPSSTSKPTRPIHNAKHIEVLGFCTRSHHSRALRADTVSEDTTGGAAQDEALPLGPPRTTYFVFAEGSIVGWNATWEELTWMRNILSSCASTSSPPASSGGLGALDDGGLMRTLAKKFGIAGRPTSSSSSTAAAGSTASPLAVDSMRYQLFSTLAFHERPTDDHLETPDQQSFIDVDHDRIVLEDDAVVTKLPFSYALVQSVKLDAIHANLEPVADEVKRWQRFLSESAGSTTALMRNVSRLRKAKTQLLSLVESLNFRHHTQTTPRIFWYGEFTSLRTLYRDACEHLEIEDRADAVKARMETLDETLSYLHDEVHASTNEWLTLVIIVLIAAEVSVALGFVQWFVGASCRLWKTLAGPPGQSEQISSKQGGPSETGTSR